MKKDKDFRSAYQYLQAGDLNQASNVYKKILRREPNNTDVIHMLGGIYYQLGDFDSAIRYIKKEIKIAPSNADSHNNLGLVLQAKGLFSEAIDYFKKAINLNPRFPEAHYNLGFAFQNTEQLDDAILHYQKAIKISPGLLPAYNNLGILLRVKGCFEESITYLHEAIRINPNYASTYNNLGLSLQYQGNIDEAIINFKKAINLNPAFADAYNNLGIIYKEKGQIDEAIDYYQKAVHLNPDLAEAYVNLGTAFIKKDERENAITCYQKAIEKMPNFADAYFDLGVVIKDKGQFEESIQYFQKAIQIEPDHAEAHWHLSYPFLLLGNFREGWKEYEWRLKLKNLIKPEFSEPVWDGSDIKDRTILLYTEQGFGDAIHFIRYIPLVAQRGAKIIIKCHTELITLFQSVKGIQQVIAQGEQLPQFDVHCPLMSLPFILGTTLDTIPADIPYIKADAVLVQKWKDKVKDNKSKLKVGLSWAGRPEHRNDSIRSFPLDTFAPLAQSGEVIFYSLQKGMGSEQAKNPPEGMSLVDYTDEFHDFSDTAALIENLDLIISVDTAVAHLAGAMGKRVWTLLPSAPDWRWMLKREDSPWYPTMRLFRQPSPGDWKSVINKVNEEHRLFIGEKLSEICTQDKSAHICENHESSVTQAANLNGGIMEKLSDEDDFYQTGEVLKHKETVEIILRCEGIGDCLFAIAVIKKLRLLYGLNHTFVIFTHHPELFNKCPYIEKAYHIKNASELRPSEERIFLFDTSQMPHWLVDTYDFISIPAGIGELSFREKQLEYFPVEEDGSDHYDVVINTSETWPCRSWPIENWQEVADHILAQGYSIAVVGKDTFSKADNMWKRSQGLKGCMDLTNKLSLDQTYYTIKNCGLFITCQNGLSVLSGATDTEIIVLDMSIEWSKRAIYRNEDPHYKVTYVKGNCQHYCCDNFECHMFGEFRCIPTVEQVLNMVNKKLKNSASLI